ncbi:MAG: hypothetical protein H5T64_12510 [Chloroflexi bacterium]|nr:hypothetical protein [Chloroflexota bacterium]
MSKASHVDQQTIETLPQVASYPWRRALYLAISILALLALTGCVGYVEAHITFYPQEEWKAEVRLSFTAQQVMQLGGEQAIEASLREQAATKLKEGDVRYTWKKEPQRDGGITYIVSIEGRGLQKLNETAFSGMATIYVDESSRERRVVFSAMPAGLLGGTVSLRLTGGKIISSNADELKGNTAIWYNLTFGESAEAVLTETSRTALPCPVSTALVVFVMGLCLLWRR